MGMWNWRVWSELASIGSHANQARGAILTGGALATQGDLRESVELVGDDERGSLGNW